MLILDSIGDIPLILHNVFIRPKQVPHDIPFCFFIFHVHENLQQIISCFNIPKSCNEKLFSEHVKPHILALVSIKHSQ